MKNKPFQLKSFVTYWLDAIEEHSLHSPFFFDFYLKIIKDKSINPESVIIEKLRQQLLTNDRAVEVLDLGSGSSHFKSSSRRVCDIARTSLSQKKYSLLYRRIIQHYKFQNILELGTSFGINTLYLRSHDTSSVTTLEGSPAIAEIAHAQFEAADTNNINLIIGNIDETLPVYLESIKSLDFIFMDAYHRYEPTLRYFEALVPKVGSRSVIVLDDIHYSPEMEEAWIAIQKHQAVFASADLYRCGILFFDPSLNKQHVVLQF